MKKVLVEYDTPGAQGVTAIMGVGEADFEPKYTTDEMLWTLEVGGIGVWVAGHALDSDGLKKLGTVASIVGFVGRYAFCNRKLTP